MPKMNLIIEHKLTQEEAVSRIKNGIEAIKKEFAADIEKLETLWNENHCDFALSVSGFSSRGTMDIKQGEIAISGDLPFMLSLFKDKIESAIKDRVKKMLEQEQE